MKRRRVEAGMEDSLSPEERRSAGTVVEERFTDAGEVARDSKQAEAPGTAGPGEAAILTLMSQGNHCLSLGTIRSRTGMATHELRVALDGLRAKGLVVRLDTVVESYASRFPGLEVDRD